MEIISGIYKVTNLINNKIYIGQSINIYQRWQAHKSTSFNKNSKEYNIYFHNALRKYGIENFNFEIIEQCVENDLDKNASNLKSVQSQLSNIINSKRLAYNFYWKDGD